MLALCNGVTGQVISNTDKTCSTNNVPQLDPGKDIQEAVDGDCIPVVPQEQKVENRHVRDTVIETRRDKGEQTPARISLDNVSSASGNVLHRPVEIATPSGRWEYSVCTAILSPFKNVLFLVRVK